MGGNKNVLKLDSGGSCTTLKILKTRVNIINTFFKQVSFVVCELHLSRTAIKN